MLHRWAHHDSHGGSIWSLLKEFQEAGLISELGASIYTPEEAMAALQDPVVHHLQIPFNLLDHRWIAPEFQTALEKRPEVTIHVRSAYLQGILLSGPDTWPKRTNFDPKAICEQLDALVRDLNRQTRADLCLAYLNSCAFVDSIVVGVETMEQFRSNLELFKQTPLSPAEKQQVVSDITNLPDWLLDPSQW
jgi:spore coat polysaccharide biosynthesis protein SpsF